MHLAFRHGIALREPCRVLTCVSLLNAVTFSARARRHAAGFPAVGCIEQIWTYIPRTNINNIPSMREASEFGGSLDQDTLQLRLAGLNDVELLQYWDTKPHVISSGGEDDVLDWEEELKGGKSWIEILIAEYRGKPVGCLYVIDPAEEETHYWGKVESGLRAIDIWIGEEQDLGKGYGSAMMKSALARCFQDPSVSAVLVDPLQANTRAHRFYQRLGFERVGMQRFGSDDCVVHRLARPQWLARHAAE